MGVLERQAHVGWDYRFFTMLERLPGGSCAGNTAYSVV